jgi:tetratricopeptide (TPR) repeat protein
MYLDRSRSRQTSPRRIVILIILIVAGLFVIANQNALRQQLIPPPTPTATRTARSYVVEAQSLAEAGKIDEAIGSYIQATALDSANIDVLIELSRLLALTQRTDDALQWALRAAQLAPQSARAKAALAMALDWNAASLEGHGRAAEAQPEYQQAIDAAQAASSIDPNYPEAYAYLAETYADLNRWAEAIDAAQKAVDLNPNRVDVQRALGYVRESQGNYSGAAQAYEQALQFAPNLPYLYIVLGRNYRVIASVSDASRYQKAIDAFKHAIALDPKNVVAYDELGWTYYNFDQLTEAQKALEQAVAIDPQSWSAAEHLAVTYYSRRNYEDASITFKTAIGLMNQSFDGDHYCVTSISRACDRLIEAYYTLGLSFYYLSQCETESYPAFQKALVLRPDEPNAKFGVQLCNDALITPTPTPKPK